MNDPESYTMPVTDVYGNSSGRTRLRRRTSAPSIPTASATASIVRSIVKQAAGRETPR